MPSAAVARDKGQYLLNLGRAEYDEQKRADIYKQINRILLEDVPRIYIIYPKLQAAALKKVQGLVAYPDYVLRLRDVGLRA